jgi:hypothetical protein
MISKKCGQGKRPDLLLFLRVIIAAKLQMLTQKIDDTEAIRQCPDRNLYHFLKTSNYSHK